MPHSAHNGSAGAGNVHKCDHVDRRTRLVELASDLDDRRLPLPPPIRGRIMSTWNLGADHDSDQVFNLKQQLASKGTTYTVDTSSLTEHPT